ncbi:hypothetical protein [Bacteroides ovatus]|uniref:hypothetical protein n=1 Tax=Bacteroides ovatus TaxID=28116 RepID=UPI0021646994|nr:hypothetical protein [Bacteroides ovatus]UVR36322.1 hypothetical protein NXV29_14065 [Bacteroides ovatus]
MNTDLFFPVISIFDASGYGGIIDVINQFGLLGLILWGMILKKIYHLTSNWKIVFLSQFPFFFGVQMTFLYPWLLIGIMLDGTQIQNEKCDRLITYGRKDIQ